MEKLKQDVEDETPHAKLHVHPYFLDFILFSLE
jgi:hypothetical protein